MSDPLNEGKKPLDATVDTVSAAVQMLWDWLTAAPGEQPSYEPEPKETRIPAEVVDTEGKDV